MSEHKDKINVRVVTSSGSYPEHGNQKVSVTEAVQEILTRAAAALKITDTTNWVAKVKGREIEVSQTYAHLGLHGEAKLDYGRREGGGG
jgi:hypothetical protein